MDAQTGAARSEDERFQVIKRYSENNLKDGGYAGDPDSRLLSAAVHDRIDEEAQEIRNR